MSSSSSPFAFDAWFRETTGHENPRPWQSRLAERSGPESRLIRVPTGQGKTLGVLSAWIWHRVVQGRSHWPRRLVWCLPMRVLTEQTVAEARAFAERAGISDKVDVHTLMGGAQRSDWHLYPERSAILVGTQDMLLSRALNRGYASRRARWPMEMGLLSQDALWVYDEVQLMDVGLATSAQLQAYRDEDRPKGIQPVHSWWMSATLQPDWLRSPDTQQRHSEWVSNPVAVRTDERTSGPASIKKPLETASIDAKDKKSFASSIAASHRPGTLTLVVCNTVDRALDTFRELEKQAKSADQLAATDFQLVHSRFRPEERKGWREQFLSKEAASGVDRIIVATQVVEAGVDLSARTLVTELAPWSSLVQRFGRCARFEGEGSVIVVDRGHEEDKQAAPYVAAELERAWGALQTLEDAGIDALERLEEGLDDAARAELYPYEPQSLLLREEYEELFDTTPDLTGADLDIARFIRSGEERDIQVAWELWEGKTPPRALQPAREALCSVPIGKARDWLKGSKAGSALHFDYTDASWKPINPERLRPGMVVVVDANSGGYDLRFGFDPKSKARVPPVAAAQISPEDLADAAEDIEALSEAERYQTIAEHDAEVGALAASLGVSCAPSLRGLLELAGRLHDWGKCHPAFNLSIDPDADGRPDRPDLAKAPQEAWLSGRQLYPMPPGEPRRPGFRHELASALAAFELLARHDQHHPALLGELAPVLECGALTRTETVSEDGGPIAAELAALSAEAFDLVVYLVAAHHGKLRASWQSSPQDQVYIPKRDDPHGWPLRGVREGDTLPSIPLPSSEGTEVSVPELALHLDVAQMGLNGRYGRSWRERSAALQAHYGPAGLAYLEALLRAADIRVSRGQEKGDQ